MGLRTTLFLLCLSGVARADRYTTEAVQELSRIALGSNLDAEKAAKTARALSKGQLRPEAFIDELLADPRFANVVAPSVLLGTWSQRSHMPQLRTLASAPDPKDETRIYYLSEPCPSKDAVRVHPWWALDTEVRICSDDYRPDAKRSKTGVACDYTGGELDDLVGCGCGPNLVLCAKDEAQSDDLLGEMIEEVTETIAKATQLERPLEWLYTTKETFRRPLAEFHYQRAALLDGTIRELPDLRRWPSEGRLAPRLEVAPGEQAGLLTAQGLLYMWEGHRLRQVLYDELLWCIQTRTVRTDVETILGLGHGNFRDGDGWHHLATMAPCSGCHARMDYGHQFFLGFPRGLDGWTWKRDQVATGDGTLYLRDDRDSRGRAPLTPAGFAGLAVQQPEFSRCAIQRVGQHVLGPAWDRPAFEALRDTWQATGHTLRPLMRVALLRYLDQSPTTKARSTNSSTTDAHGVVHLGSTLADRVERSCSGCHTKAPLDLSNADQGLPRESVLRMLNQVALKIMPKADAPPLTLEERRAFTRELVDAAFGEKQRPEARRYFLDELLGRRTELPSTTLAGGDSQPAHDDGLLVELRVRRDDVRYSPGLMALQAVATARRCRTRHLAGHALDACIRRGTDVKIGLDLQQR